MIDAFEYFRYLSGKTKKQKYKKPKWLIEAQSKVDNMTLKEEREWLEKAIKAYNEKGIDGLFEL